MTTMAWPHSAHGFTQVSNIRQSLGPLKVTWMVFQAPWQWSVRGFIFIDQGILCQPQTGCPQGAASRSVSSTSAPIQWWDGGRVLLGRLCPLMAWSVGWIIGSEGAAGGSQAWDGIRYLTSMDSCLSQDKEPSEGPPGGSGQPSGQGSHWTWLLSVFYGILQPSVPDLQGDERFVSSYRLDYPQQLLSGFWLQDGNTIISQGIHQGRGVDCLHWYPGCIPLCPYTQGCTQVLALHSEQQGIQVYMPSFWLGPPSAGVYEIAVPSAAGPPFTNMV